MVYFQTPLEWKETVALTNRHSEGSVSAGRTHGGREGLERPSFLRLDHHTPKDVFRGHTSLRATRVSYNSSTCGLRVWYMYYYYFIKNHQVSPGPCGLVVRAPARIPEALRFDSGSRARTRVAGSIPGQGAEGRQPIQVPLSHHCLCPPPFLPSPSSL